MRTTKDFKIKVPGTNFEIKSNTIYTVIPKPDPSAPDGFKEYGTTKVIHPSIGDTVTAPFDIEMGVWDTGFYEHSPCLRTLSEAEAQKHIKDTIEHIVRPVERIKGEGVLRHNEDNKFFDEFVVTLSNKMAFNTSEPLQLLALYSAVLAKQLCPKEELGNPKFRYAAFQVVNKDKEISNKEQNNIYNGKAVGEFYMMLKTDKEKLLKIFKYLGISDTIIEDEDVFIRVFNKYLEDKTDGYRNGKIFLDHIEKFSTEKGEEELNAFQMLNDLYAKNIVKVVRKEFYLKQTNLGNTLKNAATKVVNDTELHKAVIEISAELDEA